MLIVLRIHVDQIDRAYLLHSVLRREFAIRMHARGAILQITDARVIACEKCLFTANNNWVTVSFPLYGSKIAHVA